MAEQDLNICLTLTHKEAILVAQLILNTQQINQQKHSAPQLVLKDLLLRIDEHLHLNQVSDQLGWRLVYKAVPEFGSTPNGPYKAVLDWVSL